MEYMRATQLAFEGCEVYRHEWMKNNIVRKIVKEVGDKLYVFYRDTGEEIPYMPTDEDRRAGDWGLTRMKITSAPESPLSTKRETKMLWGVAAVFVFFWYMLVSEAQADSIDINLASKHYGNEVELNESNYGIGYSLDINDAWQARIGAYDNSFKKVSVYFMAQGHKTLYRNIDIAINIGCVTGYSNIEHLDLETTNKNLCQFLLQPVMIYHVNKNHAIEIGYIPPVGRSKSSMFTMQYRWFFDS